MSEIVSFDDLAKNLVADVGRRQDNDLTLAAQEAMQVDLRLEQTGGIELQLADEAGRLYDRLSWLHEHPLLRRFMGRNAVSLASGSYPYTGVECIETPMLLEQVPIVQGDHIVKAGYIFGRPALNYEQPRIYVDKAVQVDGTGQSRRERLYALNVYEDEIGKKMHVEGNTFTTYRDEVKGLLLEEYRQANPWSKDYTISGGVWGDGKWIGEVYEPEETDAFDHEPEFDRPLEMWRHTIMMEYDIPELLHRGNKWDYPDDMFLEPLHLLRQANQALQQRKQ